MASDHERLKQAVENTKAWLDTDDVTQPGVAQSYQHFEDGLTPLLVELVKAIRAVRPMMFRDAPQPDE